MGYCAPFVVPWCGVSLSFRVFCSIAVCLFTPLKENSVEWWGTKEASPSLSKQELTYTFRRCCLAIVAVFFGRSRAKPLNQSATFSLSPLFSGKRGESRHAETFSFFFINFCVWYLWHFSKRHSSWVKMTETPMHSCTFCLSSFNSTQIQNALYKTYVLIGGIPGHWVTWMLF